jgi:hypothetical protein
LAALCRFQNIYKASGKVVPVLHPMQLLDYSIQGIKLQTGLDKQLDWLTTV